MANKKFSVQIYVDSFDSKAMSTISNVTVCCSQGNLANFLRSLELSLRLKPTDPCYQILHVKVKLEGKYILLDQHNFEKVKTKLSSLSCKHFAKV